MTYVRPWPVANLPLQPYINNETMTRNRAIFRLALAALVFAVGGAGVARAQDEIDGRTFPERQLEERNKERREEAREKSKRDPRAPLYAPGGASRALQPAPWNAQPPRSGGGQAPWNAR